MKFASRLLRITAALFVVFGLAFVLAPDLFASIVTGTSPGAASPRIDMRAVYGGAAFGTGLLLRYCARDAARVRVGLMAALFVLAPMLGARAYGMLVDGAPNGFMFLRLVVELLLVVALALTLRRQWRADRPG